MDNTIPAQRVKPQSQTSSTSSTKSTPPRKRVSRACDECRLHKARCDGCNPCVTCSRRSRVCGYSLLPVECKGPGARVRILEHRLVRAKGYIDGIQTHLRDNALPSLNLASFPPSNLQTSFSLKSEFKAAAHTTPASIHSVANLSSTHDKSRVLIASILQPLSTNDQIRRLVDSSIIRSFLCDTGEPHDALPDNSCRLPPYDTTIEVVFAAFNSNFGLCNILVEQEFRIFMQRLYSIAPSHYTPEDVEFIPLFCSVVALGMICCASLHRTLHYDDALKESLLFFEVASTSIVNDQECTSWVKLQTTLCLVLYLLNSYKLDLVRPALQIVCSSSFVQKMFEHLEAPESVSIHPPQARTKGVLWVIHFFDMHVSALLGLPRLLPDPGPKLATVHAINTAAYNVANLRRSDETFLSSLAVAMGIELMRLIDRLSSDVVLPNSMLSDHFGRPDAAKWDEFRVGIETWELMLQSIFPEYDTNPVLYLARHYLQNHLYLAQIMLHHTSLKYHWNSTTLEDSSQLNELSQGQTCLFAATSIVQHVSTYLEHTESTTLPFHSAYVLFISLLTLIVAATHADSSSRGSIIHSVNTAVHILSSTNYGGFTTKRLYLEFIQTLSVNIDIEIAPIIMPHPPQPKSISCSPSSTSNLRSMTGRESSGEYSVNSILSPASYFTDPSKEVQDEWGFDHS